VKRLLIAAALVPLFAAAPATAAPGDRASAAAIRQATIDLHFTVTQQGPAIQAAVDRLEKDPACTGALEHLPEKQVEETVFEYILPAVLEMEFDPLKRSFTAFMAKLDAIPMRDPALRSGRAAWRDLAGLLVRFAPPPTDFCARLDAWRKAGYPAASRPKIEDPAFIELLGEGNTLDRVDRKLARAGRRLRELGVSKRIVGWWTFENLLDDIEPDEPVVEDPS
jgi:hypothetical protein